MVAPRKSAHHKSAWPSTSKRISQLRKPLLQWFSENQRPLPWRLNRDPYRIWISEIMLQQTTVVAVLPYFEAFLNAFPNVHSLAQAQIEEVYERWAGLGYYSRARNLHKAAQWISSHGFPTQFADLIKLPGLGPYTARAISSQAFGEAVGVVDGNVIRVLSRVFGLEIQHWKLTERDKLQQIADQFVSEGNPSDINQALMELGSTVCTPNKPNCLLCPWSSFCEARKLDLTNKLPLKKPKRTKEIWLWEPQLKIRGEKVLVQPNDYLPFLKGVMVFPGQAQRLDKKPKTYALKHSITHHEIYIQIQSHLKSKEASQQRQNTEWLKIVDFLKKNPSSVIRKLLQLT